MTALTYTRLRELMDHRSDASVSVFLPTHPAAREQLQGTIRLQNLVIQAEDQLRAQGMRQADARELLQPAHRLRADELFWRAPSDGVALFCATGFFRSYRVPIRLPERLVVKGRFYTKPLLPLLQSNGRYYILALTQESARLYEATRYSAREVQLPPLERSPVVGHYGSLQLQAHRHFAQGPVGASNGGFCHGYGSGGDRSKKEMSVFFQRVDRVVTQVLRDQKQAPLVLACVGYLAAIYQATTNYQQLAQGKVPGSPDRWSLDELHSHSWRLVEPRFRQTQQVALDALRHLRGTCRASHDVGQIVLAADQGRVGLLFVKRDAEQWGRVDRESAAVYMAGSEEPSGEELLDYAAARTCTSGGEVYVLDSIPSTDSPLAATFRY